MSDWNSLKRQLEEFPSPAPLDTQNPLIAVGQLSLLMRTPSLQSLGKLSAVPPNCYKGAVLAHLLTTRGVVNKLG